MIRNRRIQSLLFLALACLALIAGYWLVTAQKSPVRAAAHSATMPETLTVVYVAPVPEPTGLLTPERLKAEGVTILPDWAAARQLAQVTPLDALLMDPQALDALQEDDRAWLRARFDEGVLMVGLGVVDDRFANELGVNSFRVPAESDVPLGPSGYRMASRLALGTPADRAKLEGKNWFERLLRGDEDPAAPDIVTQPMTVSAGASRGLLDTPDDVDFFFERLRMKIEGIYNTRAEFQQLIETSKESQ